MCLVMMVRAPHDRTQGILSGHWQKNSLGKLYFLILYYCVMVLRKFYNTFVSDKEILKAVYKANKKHILSFGCCFGLWACFNSHWAACLAALLLTA